MIIVDESIQRQFVIDAIAKWYPGKVLSVTALRIATVVKDDGIDTLLHQVVRPTFVTINVDDFWRRIPTSHQYCIVAIELEQPQAHQVPVLLRRVLSLPEFRTKASRMGKIIRVRPTAVDYYERDRQVHIRRWDVE